MNQKNGRSESRRRYYVHGDGAEDKAGKFFCAGCDLFSARSHFSGECSTKNHYERYSNSLNDWGFLQENHPGKYYRPGDCINIFSGMKPPVAVQSSFYKWLARQRKRNDIIGDLAGDVRDDRKFPIGEGRIGQIRSHIRYSLYSCNAALGALDEAWREFKKGKTVREGIGARLRYMILERDEFRCRTCGQGPEDGVKLEVDHKISVSKGGTNDPANLRALCFRCNRGKGSGCR